MSLPTKYMVVDIEATHKIVADAQMITIACKKLDSKLNVIDTRDWKLAPTFWDVQHDGAVEFHGITRDEAFKFPNRIGVLREIFKWFNDDRYIFTCYCNRDQFGMWVSYDYALLMQEFWDRGPDAYYRVGQIFDRKYICSLHSVAEYAHKIGAIHVPLEIKDGNTKASRNFGLKNICKIMGVELDGHHNAVVDMEATYKLLLKFSAMFDLSEVIINDWRKDYELSNSVGEIRQRSGTEVHQWWHGGGELLTGNG